MVENNEKKNIGDTVKYLTSVLSNIKEKYTNINPKSFVNFQPDTSEEKLKEIEYTLLYGSDNDKTIDETNELPICLKKFLESKQQRCSLGTLFLFIHKI